MLPAFFARRLCDIIVKSRLQIVAHAVGKGVILYNRVDREEHMGNVGLPNNGRFPLQA